MACLPGEMVKTPGKAGPSWMAYLPALRSEWKEKVEESMIFSIVVAIAFIQNLVKRENFRIWYKSSSHRKTPALLQLP